MIDLGAVLQIIQIASIIGGGGFVIFKIGRQTGKIQLAIELQAQASKQQGEEISELKAEMKQFSALLTTVAVQGSRLDNIEGRINTLDHRYEELRHGEGYVFPMVKGRSDVR
jgi:hypothetical protein